MATSRAVQVADVVGLLVRSEISFPDGRRDTSVDVRWLQGPSLYVDLRLPPAGSGSGAEGFAGRCTSTGGLFRWQRSVDLSPPQPNPDEGWMRWAGTDGDGVLFEDGAHEAYREVWHRDPGVTGPASGFLLGEEGSGEVAVLVRVGEHFGFATAGEVSLGRVTGAGWVRERSNIASARDTDLGVRRDGEVLQAAGRRWRVTAHEGDDSLAGPPDP